MSGVIIPSSLNSLLRIFFFCIGNTLAFLLFRLSLKSLIGGFLMIRVLIAHMNSIFREGLRVILEQAGDIAVVGEAVEWEPLAALVRSQPPDVVILDGTLTSCLPTYGAMDVTSQLRAIGGGRCGIFVLVPSLDEETFFRFYKHGAAAYEPTTLAPQVFAEKVRQVARGEYLMEGAVFAPARSATRVPEPQRAQEATPPQKLIEEQTGHVFPMVSERELDVLRLVARGFSNAMVASELEITDQTVKNHISSILEKFDVFDRTSAVVMALLCKLISLDEFDRTGIATKRRQGGCIPPTLSSAHRVPVGF
jgi:DNA-binding NarL/FixJ family response regulator